MDANFAIGPIDWQLELAQGVTDFYVDATVVSRTSRLAIRIIPAGHWVLRGPNTVIVKPLDWHLELDQGVTEFYVDANFAFVPIDWQ